MHFHVATELDTRSEQTSSWSERFQECRRGGESSPEDALSEIQVQKVQVSTSPHIDLGAACRIDWIRVAAGGMDEEQRSSRSLIRELAGTGIGT